MKTIVSLITFLGCFLMHSLLLAQSFTATVIDAKTGDPIPFATVQTGTHQGTLTNEEGVFSLSEQQLASLQDSIYISSMGYTKIGILPTSANETTLKLIPETFVLDEVLLTNNTLEADEIIERVKARMAENYAAGLTQKQFFFRQSDFTQMEKMEFLVQESTIEELNQDLMDQIVASAPKRTARYRESAGTFYGNYTNYKVSVDKAADLYDESKNVSIDGLTDRLERIFKENVKPNSYLKIRSGIIGTKIELDSTGAEKNVQRDTVVKKMDYNQYVKNRLDEVFEQLFFLPNTELDFLEKDNRYRYELTHYTVLDGAPVYVLSFTPKGGRDFEGTAYVNMEDYAIVRLDFNNVKPTNRFGLFGITYRRNVLRGKMLFTKGTDGTYSPKYLELEDGNLGGVDRPLKVIEKNKYVDGPRKQNELDMDIDVLVNSLTKYEWVIFETKELTPSAFEAAKERKGVTSTKLKAYDPTFWEGYTIMEPNQAIQAFRVVEE